MQRAAPAVDAGEVGGGNGMEGDARARELTGGCEKLSIEGNFRWKRCVVEPQDVVGWRLGAEAIWGKSGNA